MTEKEFKELKPGDKVKIVNYRTSIMNTRGKMDEWLGKIMTIKEPCMDNDRVIMVEDDRWVWNAESIEYKINDFFQKITDSLKNLSYIELKKIAESVEEEIEERKNNYVIGREQAYYYISLEDGQIHKSIYTGDFNQYYMGWFGIVCKTEEDAEEWRTAILYKDSYQRQSESYPVDWEDFTQKKYCLEYSWQDKKVIIKETNTYQADGIYWSDADKLDNYLSWHKPEDVKKYILGIGMPKKCYFMR